MNDAQALNPAAFAAMPLDEQLAHLGQALPAGGAQGLLEMCALVRDHAPLAWLCRALLREGWFADARQRGWFARFLIERHETAVHKILKELVGAEGTPPASREHLRDTLLEALRIVPLPRLSSMCLLDRTLKHNWPEARDAHVAGVIERCGELLRQGRIEAVAVDLLAQVPASATEALRQIAAGAGVAEGFEARRRELAEAAIRVLGDAPKAVSQANAEELLSRRVYTDPGHFLIELLQNAEDSGATIWRVAFERDRVVVWHDGLPFDARDLVGVTSIGQTTKRKQQIGFFGVGFKSVYEITDRPRIYSDVYRFEIADVSIPKLLAERPADLPPGGTTLVLPLRDPADAARSPSALYKKACALDPCVLLTLRGIEVLDFSLSADAGGPSAHAVHEEVVEDRAGARIRQEPLGWTRTYAIQDDEIRYPLGGREAGRPDSTRLMVGVHLDDLGRPAPLPEGASTIYSYLPTSEHSGLRFFVQGHFDVPVDRERLNPDSPWNQWVLRNVPAQLARLAARLLGDDLDPAERRARALGLLGVLPLAADLTSPIFRIIPAHMAQALQGAALLPCLDGALHAPAETILASEAVAALFGGAPVDRRLLDPKARPGDLYVLDPAVDPRAALIAGGLGCLRLDTDRVVEALDLHLRALPDGQRPAPGGPLPPLLSSGDPAAFVPLFELLLEAIEALDRAGQSLALERLRERLRALPLLPDALGGLHRAKGIARGDEDIRAVYEGQRAFIHPDLDAACPGELRGVSRVTALLNWLKVPSIDVEHLVGDLERALKGRTAPLPSASDALAGLASGKPSTGAPPDAEARLGRVLALACEAPHALQLRVGRLPLFPAGDGRLYPAAARPDDLKGVLAPSPGDPGARLRDFYADRRPLLAPAAQPGPAATLLDRLQTPALDLDALVNDLARKPALFDLDGPTTLALHALLEDACEEIPERARKALIDLPIWPDLQGRPRPLRGPDAALIPAHDDVCALFPLAPFLSEPFRQRAHLKGLAVDRVGAAEVLSALDPAARPPLSIAATPALVERVLRFLLDHGQRLGQRGAERLATLPVFLSDRAHIRPVDRLSRAESPALRAIYGDHPGRDFLAPEGLSAAVIERFKLGDRLKLADASALIDDLAGLGDALADRDPSQTRLPLIGDRAGLDATLAFLAASTPRLVRASLERAAGLKIYPDQRGRLGPLCGKDLDPRAVQPCQEVVRPLLDAAGYRALDPKAQALALPLLEAAGATMAGVVTVVAVLSALKPAPSGAPAAPLQAPALLDRVQRLLIDGREALAARFSPAPRPGLPPANPELQALNIWRTVGGAVVCAADVVDAERLLELTEPGSPARAAVDARRLDPDARARLEALRPLMAPGSEAGLARALVANFARPLRPLSEQPGALSSIHKIASLLAILCPDDQAPPPEVCPLVDAVGRLRLDRLQRADADALALVEGLGCHADLLHPSLGPLPPALDRALKVLAPWEILIALEGDAPEGAGLADHPVLSSPARRAAFYRWLVARERDIFSDSECRKLLRSSRLFPTERDSLLTPGELVIDPDLPDLGIDWRPHPEIPAEALGLLARHLDVGRPPIDELVRHHLGPAYGAAVREAAPERAAQILTWLARQVGDWPEDRLRALLQVEGAASWPLEDQAGAFQAADKLLLPSGRVARFVEALWGAAYARPSDRYPVDVHGFLLRLGVARTPSLERVRGAMERAGASPSALMGLAGLVGHLHAERPQEVEAALPLGVAPWIVDGAGNPRRPGELFGWAPEIEALVGAFPELYPAEGVMTLLGEALVRALGFRGADKVAIEDVVRHIDHRAQRDEPVPFRVYQWFEQGLADGWIDRKRLLSVLDERAWVCTDDGRFFNHRKVVGVLALSLFGGRRGYWDWGRRSCPKLCEAFKIEAEVRPQAVAAFLSEVGREILALGDAAVLEQDPALPRMLLACAALLGESGLTVARTSPVILCHERGRGGSGGLRLLPATAASLLRSDTPTLEALFEEVGVMHLVARGAEGERLNIDKFYAAMGIARLREAYTVAVDAQAGQDRTEALADGVHGLRGVLKALLEVLPRVRQQRALLSAAHWVDGERLGPLARTGSLRAIEQLRVRYLLRGVGAVHTKVAAVYDPHRKELLVDTQVLTDPTGHTTGLAVGLMPCLYDGPGEDQLVDIVEILLPLRSAARMHAYLDRRHFPRVEAGSPKDRLSDRLGEILDFGLHNQLARRFEALAGRDMDIWRSPDLMARLPAESDDEAKMAQRAAVLLLDALGLTEPPAELTEALVALLSAASLDDLPEGFLRAPSSAPPDLAPIEAAREDRQGEPVPVFTPAPSGEPGRRSISNVMDNLMRDLVQRRQDGAAQGESGDPAARATSQPAAPPPDPFQTPGADNAPARRILERLAEFDRAALRDPQTGQPRPWQPQGPWRDTGEGLPGADAKDLHELAEGARARQPAEGAQPPGATLEPVREGEPAARPQIEPVSIGRAKPSMWERFSRWLGTSEVPAVEPHQAPLPGWAGQGANSLAPSAGIPPQLWATPRSRAAVAATPTIAGMTFEPRRLPVPFLYAVHSFGATFDEATQHWSPQGAPERRSLAPARPSGRSAAFEGRLMPGTSQLPLPLYGALQGSPQVVGGDPDAIEAVHVDAFGMLTVKIAGAEPVLVRYEVDLLAVPALTGAGSPGIAASPALTIPTLPFGELPREVRHWIEAQRSRRPTGWERALAVQQFVQHRYLYEDDFMDRPEVARKLESLRPGKGHHHLELLHASGDEALLGRGICYELNTMVMEILRHLEVPCLLATGWVLDQGRVDRPDHLFALAILPSAQGPSLFPLDAATGRQGPIRPLSLNPASARPEGVALPERPPVPPVPGPWSVAAIHNAPDEASVDAMMADLRRTEQRQHEEDVAALSHIVRLVCEARSMPEPADLKALMSGADPPAAKAASLRRMAEDLLGSSALVGAMVGLMRGELRQFAAIPPTIQELVRLGLVEVRTIPIYEVSPTRR